MKKYSETAIIWGVYAIFACTLFFDCVWLHYSCSHSILISSIWNNPLAFWSFYLPKIFISCLFASPIFFMKRKWGIITYAIILDFWFLANCVYFRSYGNFIDAFALSMAGNMDGFWGAVLLFLDTRDLFYFALTVLFVILLYCLPKIEKRAWKLGLITIAISYVLTGFVISFPNYLYRSSCGVDKDNAIYEIPSLQTILLPFSKHSRNEGMGVALEYDFSVLHYIGFDFVDYISIINDKANLYVMTDDDLIKLQPCLGVDTCQWNGGKQIIIFILVESLEAWAVRPEIMPNTYGLLLEPSFYASKVTSQVRSGGSADGQMIINTGILPIKEDAVCFRFPLNKFPTYPKGKSVTIIPHPIEVWNQVYMSPAYGYDTTVVASSEDIALFSKTIEMLDAGYDMIQIVTMTSHAPFDAGISVEISAPNELPSTLHDYLGCLHLTDAGIGLLLDRVKSDSDIVNNTTIILTGDHTIFPSDKRNHYSDVCAEKQLEYAVYEAFCPLIIASPLIKESIFYSDTCYQMDIFPTVLKAMGYDNNYWNGVGTCLLKDKDCSTFSRKMDEKTAFDLSDKLMRANYFSISE